MDGDLTSGKVRNLLLPAASPLAKVCATQSPGPLFPPRGVTTGQFEGWLVIVCPHGGWELGLSSPSLSITMSGQGPQPQRPGTLASSS